jgi:NADH:ubiquinone oxidoreductase subunit 5 (subunit L)/multisubunit Na+/H+ antiporter MnhA subunit
MGKSRRSDPLETGRVDPHRARKLDWTFRVDSLSTTMMLVVSGVGTLIHIYAIGYMHEDVRFKNDPGRFRRFFVFLNLFIAAMMILVSGDSYLMLFVGWEGVGLCSFLLIGFWYDMDTLGVPRGRTRTPPRKPSSPTASATLAS